MFEFSRLLVLAILILSIIYYVVVTGLAYAKRKDRSFGGGYFMLNGWWLFWPYGKNGIPRELKHLVTHGRMALLMLYLSVFIFWWFSI